MQVLATWICNFQQLVRFVCSGEWVEQNKFSRLLSELRNVRNEDRLFIQERNVHKWKRTLRMQHWGVILACGRQIAQCLVGGIHTGVNKCFSQIVATQYTWNSDNTVT
ncbi:Hypothetical_protein [Hexamita inflata]|uniref:Hypothetical_protein n=1 Tax=Hexamita inflata TaxID=28002 RepID=A0AA86PKS5_9EUKA|nr:Hypothetical protein HINF_LOCUS27941 [Hexamita inflata]